jgi:hypothetical protein
MESLLMALIWLLVYALAVAIVAYIVTRLASQFVPGFAPFAWIVWAIAGLVLLLLAVRLFSPLLGAV